MATKHKEPVWLCTKIHHKSVEPGNSQRNWEDKVGNISIFLWSQRFLLSYLLCYLLFPRPTPFHSHPWGHVLKEILPISGYSDTLIHKFTLHDCARPHQMINEPNTDNAHRVLLPLLQWPSPTLVSVDPICGHTLKLITWNLCTSHLRYCLSHAWPQPPVLPPLLTQQSLWAAQLMISLPPAPRCPLPNLDWYNQAITSTLVSQVPSFDNCQNMNK